ncbi:hypothetical protein GCM10009789_23520 [Kribbella sancticallisti]|uniref:Uncharacterized protein n=1 Tax=Kribbella sancticallisti TaxID=460087 RepID=A0ABN2D2X3_9ACTN
MGDVPAECYAGTTAYRSDGQRLLYRYDDSKPSVEAIQGDKLPWIPTAQQVTSEAGSDTSLTQSGLATHPTDGYLYGQSRGAILTDGVWKMSRNTATRIAAGFGNTRIIAWNRPYLYRVTGNSLYRYTMSTVSSVPTNKVKLPGTRWDTVNTLIFERTGGTGAAAVDVLLGTKANGELKEWRVNRATPTSGIASTVLRASGWSSITSLTTGYCEDHPNGRPLLAINAAGAASVHFDANAKDRSGTDIKGGSLGSLGWTAKAYGQ